MISYVNILNMLFIDALNWDEERATFKLFHWVNQFMQMIIIFILFLSIQVVSNILENSYRLIKDH